MPEGKHRLPSSSELRIRNRDFMAAVRDPSKKDTTTTCQKHNLLETKIARTTMKLSELIWELKMET